MQLATVYDLINTAIFLPWGGSRRIRRALVDALHISPGDRVLDLGCGTGLVTEMLVGHGARTTGVDRLPEMLAGARRRAPEAQLIRSDLLDDEWIDAHDERDDRYDAVTLSFVLHNFASAERTALLRRAASHLASGSGRIGILEWAEPTGRRRAHLWRWFLAHLEPSPSVPEILDGALDRELLDAGLIIEQRRDLAGGRVQLLVLEVAR